MATVPGETLWMEIDVEAPFDIKEFTVHAYFVINGVSIECQLSENDYALSLMLPIVEHANFTCFIEFPIYEFLPPIPMELLLVFEGQNGAVIAGGSIDLDVYEGI